MLYTVKDHDIQVPTMETSHHCAMRHAHFVHYFINIRSVPAVTKYNGPTNALVYNKTLI
jgi:hypothetical protein